MTRRFVLLLTALTAVASAWGYVLHKDDSGVYVIKWQSSPVTLQVKLSTTANLGDGTSQSSSLAAAMAVWNAQLGTEQLLAQASSGTYATGNGINEVVMDSTVGGEAFSNGVLAITASYWKGNSTAETDIIFNTAYTWDSYRGVLRRGSEDLRRVAIHELGHALGLMHPDEAGQSVVALMNSHESDLDTLAADDIAGGHKLYAAPGFVPANNPFSTASALTLSGPTAQVSGSNIAADRETGEPRHADTPKGHSVWWTWTAAKNDTAVVDTRGSDFDTVLAVYTGSTVSTLTLVGANDDEESPADNATPQRRRTSKVTFNAVGGTTYFLAVDGWAATDGSAPGYTGSVTLNLNLATPVPPQFTTQPSARTVEAGQTAQFSASSTGTPAPTYRWQRLTTGGAWADLSDMSGLSGTTTGTLSVITTLAMNGDQFRCVATNSAGSATSGSAALTVIAPAVAPSIATQPIGQMAAAGTGVSFSVVANGTAPLSFQWKKNGQSIFDGGSLSGAASASLAILAVQPGDAGSYTVTVSNSKGAVTSTAAVLTVSIPPPMITSRPRTVAASAGSNVTLTVNAGGFGIFHYQWKKDGAVLSDIGRFSGTSGASLTIEGIQPADAGSYTITVSNDGGATTPSVAILVVNPPAKIVAVAAGGYHSLFIRKDGTLWGMGSSYFGQLGDGEAMKHAWAALIANEVASVAAGPQSSFFVKLDGTLWAMGLNHRGQLGDGTTSNHRTPVLVAHGVLAVSTGDAHSLFIKSDGTLWGVGRNVEGQLGDGTNTDRLNPIQIATGVVAAAAGGSHSLFVKSDGTLWSVGHNDKGQLGDGSNIDRNTPKQIAATVTAVAASEAQSFYIMSDGTLWGMGYNRFGELGDGNIFDRNSPFQMASEVVSVSAGWHQTYFIKTDHSLWASGENFNGQISASRNGAFLTPIQIATSVVSASANSDSHGIYVTADGTLYTRGIDSDGQLGDGALDPTDNNARVTKGPVLGVKPSVVVAADDKTRGMGTGNPTFTASYSGFINGDTVTSLDVVPMMSTTADRSSPAGTYPITLGGGSDNDYDFVLDNGTLTVGAFSAAPSITSASFASFTAGTAINFTVTATGSPTPTFSATGLPGWASLNPLTGMLSGTPPNSERSPFAITFTASNGVSPNASQSFTLTILAATSAPNFINQPASQSTRVNGSATFSVGANGIPAPSYRWQLSANGGGSWTNVSDGAPYSGAGTATLTISGASFGMNGYQYRCIATNTTASATSNAATLTVTALNAVGTYFGQMANNRGRWALKVNSDNTAVYIAYLTQRKSAVIVHLTIGPDGTFSTTGTETVPLSAVGNIGALSLGGARSRGAATVASNFTLSGQISSGAVSGQLTGLDETFSGAIDSAAGSIASGYYRASALNTASGGTYAIIAPSGQAVIVTVSASVVDGATGTVGSNGQLSATTSGGGQLAVTINGSAQSLAATLTPAGSTTPISFAGLADTVQSTARLVNIATRAYCSTDNKVTIGGFVVSGSAAKRVLVRAVGPSLTAQGLGTGEVLADPMIEVHDAIHGNSIVATNDNWGDNPNAAEINTVASSVGASALLGSDTKSSTSLLNLQPGVYSFVVNGKAATSGVVLLEVYDADATPTGATFANIATRAQATTGNGVTIGGFVIAGNAPKHVLLRAVGPTLTKQGLGVAEVLTDPTIELHDAINGNLIIATNDNWGDVSAEAAAITAAGARIGATPFDQDDTKSAALLVTLQPGVYSFIASGKAGAPSGIVLVEVYDAD